MSAAGGRRAGSRGLGRAGGPASPLALALLLAAAMASCGPSPRSPSVGQAGERQAKVVTSNVTRADHAGSQACSPCHAELVNAWQASPMHRMTRLPEKAEVHAPFDGSVFRFKDDAVRLETRGGDRLMHVTSPRFGDQSYRVTKIIGGRYREDFAGVPLAGGKGSDELILPVTYAIGARELRYKGYSVMATERPGMRAGPAWNKTCVFCHNTVPFLSTALGALHGPGAPGFQGVVVDPLLPEAKRRELRVTDPHGLGKALADEERFLGVTPKEQGEARADLRRAILATRAKLGEGQLAEVGIGCEACHNGCAEHARDPSVKTSFEPRSPFLSAPHEGESVAEVRACARCHQVLFSQYPYTWEGGERRSGPGGSHISSGEARDFMLGGCSSALRCSSCHDLHGDPSREKLARLELPEGNGACTGCHSGYASPEALRAHAHHDPRGQGASCVRCHMPRKNMSLDGRLSPYHRIGSPTDQARVERDRPLECSLCHADKSAASLVTTMESWWGKRYDRARLEGLYGSLDRNALVATLERGKPHEQAVAIFALGEARSREALPLVAGALTHRYPIVRYYARSALERITGKPCPVDVHQKNEEVAAQAARWLGTASQPPPPTGPLDDADPED